MERNNDMKWTSVIAALLSMVIAMPASAASTKDEVRALKAEIETLKQGQEQIQGDLAEIKKLLEQRPAAAPAARQGATSFTPKDLVVGDSPTLGETGAPVTLFAYSDYQCPFCSRHATTVLPRLVQEYVDEGKLRIVMREYPIEAIHPRAFAAAQAALCAHAQGRYWDMHDMIFANPRNLADADLSAHAGTLELDEEAFNACLEDEDVTGKVQSEVREAYDLGISGTPSFVAGRTDPENPDEVHVTEYIRGAQPFARFQGVIDGLLGPGAESE